MKVAALGDHCLDVYIAQGKMTAGGNAVNVAANCWLSGHRALYIGPVGDDQVGEMFLRQLSAIGLPLDGVQRLPDKSGVTLIELHNSDRRFLLEEFGVCAQWVPTLESHAEETFDWIHVGGPTAVDADFHSLAEATAWLSVDLSTMDLSGGEIDLNHVDVAFASADLPPGSQTVEAGQAIRRLGAKETVIMCGAEGSTWVGPQGGVHQTADHIVPTDTCGAGDSFISGFMLRRAAGSPPSEALRSGTSSASATCMHIGGFPQEALDIPAWLREGQFARFW